jgi:predicted transcriptional regulator YheO
MRIKGMCYMLKPEDVEKIKQDIAELTQQGYKKKKAVNMVAKKLYCSSATIWKRLRGVGVAC